MIMTMTSFGFVSDAQIAPHGWRTPYIPALLPLSAILLALFVFWEKHLEQRQFAVPKSDGSTRHVFDKVVGWFDGVPPLIPMKVISVSSTCSGILLIGSFEIDVERKERRCRLRDNHFGMGRIQHINMYLCLASSIFAN
jgi:hypothetical protein